MLCCLRAGILGLWILALEQRKVRGGKEEEPWRLTALEAAFQSDHIGPSFVHVFHCGRPTLAQPIFTAKAGVGWSLAVFTWGRGELVLTPHPAQVKGDVLYELVSLPAN